MADKQLQFEATVSAAALNKLLGDLQNGAEGAAKAINDALGGTVTKKLLLETVTDVSGARSLVAVEKERLSIADQIINKNKQLDKIQRGSATSLRQQFNEAKQLRDGIARYANSISSVGGQLKTVNPLWAAQNAKVAKLRRELDIAEASGFWSQIKTGFRLQGVASFFNGLTQVTQGLQSATIIAGQFAGAINDLLNSAADLQSFELSFKAIGAGSAGAVKGLQESARIALGLGVSLQTVQDGFRQLSPVVLNSGGSLRDVSGIVEALSSRFAAYGISGDKARRVTNGVIQAFAKGKLQAEELTQQISEADPAFKTELAEAIKASITELKGFGDASDFTVQKLEQFVKQGKITSDVLIKVLPALSKADLLFGKLGPTANSAVDALARGSVTIDQVRTNLDNLSKLNLRNIAKIAGPLIQGFLRVRAVVTDFFTRLSESATAKTLVDVFGRIVNIVAKVADSFLLLVDGVLSITNAIAPFVDILLKIPGSVELVAAALAGRLLKGFSLFKQKVDETVKTVSGFTSNVGRALTGVQAPIIAAQKPISDLRKKLEKPLSGSLITGFDAGTKQVVASTKQAVSQVEALETSAKSSVGKTIEKTESRIRRLYKRLQELKAEAASVVLPETTQGNAGVEKNIKRATSSMADFKTAIFATSNTFDQVVDRLDKIEAESQGAFDKKKIQAYKQEAQNLAKTLAFAESTTQGKAVGQAARIITPEFISQARELAKTDATKAVSALQLALRGVQGTIKDLSTKVGPGFDNIRQLATASLNDVKTAIAEIVNGNTDLASSQSSVGSALQGVGAEIRQTEQRARELSSELGRKPSGKGVDSAIDDQKRLQAEIKKTIRELRGLYDKEQSLKAGRTGLGRSTGGGSVADRLSKEVTVLDLIQKKLTDVRVEQAKTGNSRVQSIDAEIAATRESLRAIEAAQKARADIAKKFRLPIADAGATTESELRQADALRDKLANLNTQRAEAINLVENNAKAESDLSTALANASDETASFAERQRAASSAVILFNRYLAKTAEDSDKLKGKIAILKTERDKLLKQQAARPFFGPVDRASDPLLGQIDEYANKINDLELELQRVEQTRDAASGAIDDIGGSFLEGEKKAKSFGDTIKSLKSFAGGIVTAPFKSLKSLFSSLKGLAVGLAAALGPLQIILIAAGVASRLYQDGNRKSAAITKDFAESTELLNAALKDLNPEAQDTAKNNSALARTWQALANVVAGIGNTLGGYIEGAAQALERFASGLKNALGPLGELIAKISLISGGVALGALIGSIFGPVGTGIGAVAGGALATLGALTLGASEASISIAELKQSLKTLKEEVTKQAPALKELYSELNKLTEGGKVDPKDLTKYVNGVNAAEDALDQQRKKIDETSGALKKNQDTYKANIKQLDQYRRELKAAEDAIRDLRERGGAADPRGEGRSSRFAPEIERQQGIVDGLKGKIAELEKQTIELGTSNNEAASELAGLNQELEKSEIELDKLRKAGGLVTSDQKDLINSLSKLKEKIDELENSVGDFDLFSDTGRQNLSAALTQARALKTIFDEISKTEIAIAIETADIEQSITESQLKIDLDEGPLREAALAVSKVTNELARAQQEFQLAIAALSYAEGENAVDTKLKAELIERAAKTFLEASQKSKAEIIELGRKFKDSLDSARSSYQDLILGKPGFFTPGEIRANAQQIEKDFEAALNKVRQQTGDWTWGPTLEGKTYDEILAQKKAFVDARKQADELVDSIKQLNQVLSGLALVLAKISGVSLEQLQAAGFDPSKIIKGAQDSQQAITGIGAAAQEAAKAYGEIIGTVEGGGQKLVLAVNKATGQVESLTEEEYNAANASAALKKAGVDAFNAVGSAASNSLDGVLGQTQSYKTVIGELEAGGEKLLIIQDQFNGRTDTVTAKMAAQMGIVNNLADAYKNLGIQISKSQEQAPSSPSTYPTPTAQTIEIAASLNIDPGITQQVRDAAQQAGGDFTRAFAQLIATDSQNSGTMFAQGVLGNLGTAVTNYKNALETLAIAERQAKEAQDQYNAAVAIGGANLYTAAGAVANANDALEAAQNAAATAGEAYADAAESARALGIDISSVPAIGETLQDTGIKTLGQAYDAAREKALAFYESLQAAPDDSGDLEGDLENTTGHLDDSAGKASGMAVQLERAAKASQTIESDLNSLPNKISVDVNVTGIPGLWTGGPTTAGQIYRVNELGQEGFLSAAGNLTAIQRPKNALWRAPSAGTVIPAHIMQAIDYPTGEVKANAVSPKGLSGVNSNLRLAKAIALGLSAGPQRNPSMQELASVQAAQARQIGNLSRAINDLSEKDWNVNVKVRGSSSLSYMNTINRLV